MKMTKKQIKNELVLNMLAQNFFSEEINKAYKLYSKKSKELKK